MTGKFTNEKCLALIAKNHNINILDLDKVFQETKSIDKVIEVANKATELQKTALDTWEFMNRPEPPVKFTYLGGASKIVKLKSLNG